MLGRVRMSVDECIRAYKTMATKAFTPKKGISLPVRPTGAFSATALEVAIKSAVEESIGNTSDDEERPGSEALFRDDTCCKT